MVMSMTGFGRAVKQTSGCIIQVEIKTVNHRYREYHLKIPQQLSNTEMALRNRLGKYFNRGRVEVSVKMTGQLPARKELHIDWDLLDSYDHFIQEIKKKYSVPGDAVISDYLRIQDAVEVVESGDRAEELSTVLISAADEAAEQVLRMRHAEGIALSNEIHSYIDELEERVLKVKEQAPAVLKKYTDRLKNKLSELMQDHIDESRLLAEAAIFADKVDISEEAARLHSHIAQFREALHASGPTGRKMDFIIQEMNREVNTIGSKGNDSFIANLAVDMKVLLEKLREQVQNIE